jgi:hypothetical protein
MSAFHEDVVGRESLVFWQAHGGKGKVCTGRPRGDDDVGGDDVRARVGGCRCVGLRFVQDAGMPATVRCGADLGVGDVGWAARVTEITLRLCWAGCMYYVLLGIRAPRKGEEDWKN